MSWTPIKRAEHNRTVRTVSVRITKVGYPQPRMVIRISRALAAEAGIPVTEPSRVNVFVGADENAGKIKVESRPGAEWFCECRGKNEALKIVTPRPSDAPEELATTECRGETGDGHITLTMPWAGKSEHWQKTWTDEVPAKNPTRAVAGSTTSAPPPATASVSAKNASPAAKDWCEEREVKEETPGAAPSDAPPSSAKPVAPSGAPKPKPAPSAGMRTFKHGKESVALSAKHYDLATQLYGARKKGFLVYAQLMAVAKTENIDTLKAMVSTLKKQLWPLGLAIDEVAKMGYQMKESLSSGNGAGA